MRTVEDSHILPWHSFFVQRFHLRRDPVSFRFCRFGMVAQNRSAGRTRGGQVLFDAQRIFADQGIGGCQDLRRRTVILHHQNGLYLRESLVKIKQIADICAAPCVDGLVRITDDEQILVVPHQHMHQLILECIDILELVDHNVFQAFLPLQPDLFLLLKDIEGKFDQIVVIEAEALLFLIEIAVKNDVGHFGGLKVICPAAHQVASGSFPDSNRDT